MSLVGCSTGAHASNEVPSATRFGSWPHCISHCCPLIYIPGHQSQPGSGTTSLLLPGTSHPLSAAHLGTGNSPSSASCLEPRLMGCVFRHLEVVQHPCAPASASLCSGSAPCEHLRVHGSKQLSQGSVSPGSEAMGVPVLWMHTRSPIPSCSNSSYALLAGPVMSTAAHEYQ